MRRTPCREEHYAVKNRRSSVLPWMRGALWSLTAAAALGLPTYLGNGSTAQAATRPRTGSGAHHTAKLMPVIQRFTLVYRRGGTVELVWITSHATRVTLNGRLIAAHGTLTLRRTARRATYLLVASNGKRRVARGLRITPITLKHRGRLLRSHTKRHHTVIRHRHHGPSGTSHGKHHGSSPTSHGKHHGSSPTSHGKSHGVNGHRAPAPATATPTAAATDQPSGAAPAGTLAAGPEGTLPHATSTASTSVTSGAGSTAPAATSTAPAASSTPPSTTSTAPAASSTETPASPTATSTQAPPSPTATATSTASVSATTAQPTHTPSPSATDAANAISPDNGGPSSNDVLPAAPTATPELGSGELLLTGLVPTIGVLWLRRRRRASQPGRPRT